MDNFFEFFDLPIKIGIDEKELKKKYLKKSRLYHPDFVDASDQVELEKAERMTSFTNEVYKTLSDFHERISYILLLNGLIGEPGQNQMSQDFLMDVMEINEEIMELQFDPNEDRKNHLLKKVKTFQEEITKDAQNFFDAFDQGDHSSSILDGLKDYFLKNKYLLRMHENLEKIN